MDSHSNLPGTCPRCGGTRLVRILWCYATLTGEEARAIANGTAMLGLNYRYSRPVELAERGTALLLERSRLPSIGCLDCKPEWIALHRLAMKEWEANTAKDAASSVHDFERATREFAAQLELESVHAPELLSLVRILVGEDGYAN